MSETTPGAALVTGAALRIGRAIALDLGRHGWAVAVHYNGSAEAAGDVVDEITTGGGRAAAFAADLADEAEAEALVPRCAGALGPLTCLVNNAAVFGNDRLATATRESWDAHLDVNLRAPVVLIRAFVEQLPKDAAGNVINLLDQQVWNLGAEFFSYTVSKAGLWTLTRSLALALAPRVRVNAIGPGPTLPSKRQTDAQFAAHCARLPLGRGTTPEEICRAVRFILAAPAMTGQMIALDGGEHLGDAPPKTDHAGASARSSLVLEARRQTMSQATPPRPAPLADAVACARRLFIHDLTLDCRIGVHRHEQDVGQRVRINIDLAVRDDAPIDDKIANVVSYDDIVAGVKAIVARGHVNLAETLAERIVDVCMADARVAAVRVRVEKLDAIREAASVGVEIERVAERR